MSIRTLKFALQRDPANSRAIGYHATQQNAAYNVAVDVLNREPELPKRSGKGKPDAMNKRITAWQQAYRVRHSRSRLTLPLRLLSHSHAV